MPDLPCPSLPQLANATVSGIFTTTAAAVDASGVTKVDFYLDNTAAIGTPAISDVASPYNYSLNTLSPLLVNGNHTITAKAYDAVGNSSLAGVTVNVQNPDTTAPSAPTGLSATIPAATPTQANLSWTASTDNGLNASGVAKYNILRDSVVIAQVTPATNCSGSTCTYVNAGLTASTTYSYTVQAVDAANNISANSNTAAVTTPAASVLLLGNQAVQSSVDNVGTGQAEAFKTTAVASGTASKMSLYLDAGSTASSVKVGFYSNLSNHPKTLLGQVTITAPQAGAWNIVTLPTPAASLTSGTVYWIAVLNPKPNTGTIKFRDKATSSSVGSETSYQTTLTSLPATWISGTTYTSTSLSGYVTN